MANYEMMRDAWLRNQARYREAAVGTWRWPLDMAAFDRDPALRVEERAELQRLFAHVEDGNSGATYRGVYQSASLAVSEYTALTRLVAPLCDVLDIVGATKKLRHMTLRVLLQEMARRHMACWGWERSDWLAILRSDLDSFNGLYRVATGCRQQVATVGYLLGGVTDFRPLTIDLIGLAETVFGKASVESAMRRIEEGLREHGTPPTQQFSRLLSQMLLVCHSPLLADLGYDCLHSLYQEAIPVDWRPELIRITYLLVRPGIGAIERTLPYGIPAEWVRWCQRWYDASTIDEKTRRRYYRQMLKVGRWLVLSYPDVHSPEQWTPLLTQAYIKEVERLQGEQRAGEDDSGGAGKPGPWRTALSAETGVQYVQVVRSFFRDCRHWGWLDVEFETRPARVSSGDT